MDKIKEFLKAHGWTVAIVAVVGVLALILIMRGRSSGGVVTSVPSQGGADPLAGAQLQSQTQLALAGMQLQGQAADYAGQLALASEHDAASYALAQYQGDQNFALQTQSLGLEAALQTLQINTNAQLTQYQLDSQLAGQSMAYQSAFALQQLQTDANIHVADTNAATTIGLAGINAQTQTALAQFATQVNLANISATSAAAQAQIAGQVQMNAANNRTTRHSSNNNLIGGIIGAGLALFSDERVKSNVIFVRRREDGLGIYRYDYAPETGIAGTYEGVLAQEVRALYPAAVREMAGVMAVNYDLIGETLRRVA